MPETNVIGGRTHAMLNNILAALKAVPLNCEVEFPPVGSGAKAGNAIVVRYGDDTGYKLMLLDGGHSETGARTIDHLRKYFGPCPVLEDGVLTHLDGDHASGIRKGLEEVKRTGFPGGCLVKLRSHELLV